MLIEPATLAAFLAAGIVLNLTPGADVMFAMASGAQGGWRSGIAAAAGVSAGSLVHTALTAFGLAALLAAHPGAFDVIRWAGAAYLLWLAWKSWHAAPMPSAGALRLSRAFGRGFLTNLLNPKVALFLMAFLPQFADPTRSPVWLQMVLLGALFSLTGFVITGGYGVLAGTLRDTLTNRARVLNRFAALVFAGLAARLAFD